LLTLYWVTSRLSDIVWMIETLNAMPKFNGRSKFLLIFLVHRFDVFWNNMDQLSEFFIAVIQFLIIQEWVILHYTKVKEFFIIQVKIYVFY
jgi:hypothetical protein